MICLSDNTIIFEPSDTDGLVIRRLDHWEPAVCPVTIPPRTREMYPDWRWRAYLQHRHMHLPGLRQSVHGCIEDGLKPIWSDTAPQEAQYRWLAGHVAAILRTLREAPWQIHRIMACAFAALPFEIACRDRDHATIAAALFMDVGDRVGDEAWVREWVYLPLMTSNPARWDVWTVLVRARVLKDISCMEPAPRLTPRERQLRETLEELPPMLRYRPVTPEEGRTMLETLLGPVKGSPQTGA